MKFPPLNTVDYYNTFPVFISGIHKRFGNKTALSSYSRSGELREMSYSELAKNVHMLSEALCERGLSEKHIAVIGENSIEWLIAYFAIICCGGVAVCVDTEQSSESILEMIKASDAAAVFASSSFLEICRPVTELQGGLPLICISEITPDISASNIPLISINDLLEKGGQIITSQNGTFTEFNVTPDKPAAIVFTSGTTATPKMVMLSHLNLLRNASEAMRFAALGSKIFTPLPFYHTYGMTCAILDNLITGAHITINGDLRTMGRDLALARPTTVILVPLIAESIFNQVWAAAKKDGTADEIRKIMQRQALLMRFGIKKLHPKLESIRQNMLAGISILVSGGAHLEEKKCREFELFGVLVLQGYGITECSPLISVNRNEYFRHGSVGHALHDVDVKFVNEELWVKGPSVMLGYYKEPELTAEVIEDGWFKTGDIGHMDKDGFIYLTGRKKNLLVFSNGKKISPEKIETELKKIPMIKEVVVYGTSSGDSSDNVQLVASVFPSPELTEGMSSYDVLSALRLEIDRVNSGLPGYQQIKHITIREQEFAKTATKKIKRHLL